MWRIAVVEDEISSQEKLKEFILIYGNENNCDFNVSCFKDGISFLNNYKSNYDIVFMDIEMPYLDGMEVARKLRAIDKVVILIFVTNMARYAVSGYEVDATSFIVKPITYPNFSLKLSRAIEKINIEKIPFILIKGKNCLKKIKTSEIRYVEVVNHSLVCHLKDNVEQSTGSLKNISEELGKNFSFCNQCYLVNLKYCSEVTGYQVVVDGITLQISRHKRASFMKDLNLYLNGNIQ